MHQHKILALAKEYLNAHPAISVRCNAIDSNENAEMRKKYMRLGLPGPLFTFDMESVPEEAFRKFFDLLSPTFGHMISLGQSNTIVSCPSLTTHSELSNAALLESELTPTTIRVAVGDEEPNDLIEHLHAAARLTIDPVVDGFSNHFPSKEETNALIRDSYLSAHSRYIDSQLS